MVYWKHSQEAGAQPLKVNITVYDNDILQVTNPNILSTVLRFVFLIAAGKGIKLFPLGVGMLPSNVKTGGFVLHLGGRVSNN